VKTRERQLARRIRQDEGASIKEIAWRVGVSVSSISAWVRDIELSEDQLSALRAKNPACNHQISGQAIAAANRRAERVAYQEHGRRLARRREPLHIAGCMLYWAEGAKQRNQLHFSNSDPEMARLFVRFLLTYFDLQRGDIRITCQLFADHLEKQREIEQFWLTTLGLPAASLRTSVVNVYSRYSQRKRMNRLPHGTCRVVVSRTAVTQSIYGAIQEYAGITRPEWLD
jgi:transcriptional regulator with XRE-family HTH domain